MEGDVMGKLALERDERLRKNLASRFGSQILAPDGKIKTSELAKAAFATEKDQRDLTRLTFPTLYRIANEHFERLGADHKIVVFDAAMIFEWGVENDFYPIVAVVSPRETLIERAMKRLNIDRTEAINRLSFQKAPAEKIAGADRVVKNDSTLDDLRRKADETWAWIRRIENHQS